jgi:amino acid permease
MNKKRSLLSYFFITFSVFFVVYLFAQFLFILTSFSFSDALSNVFETKNLIKKITASVIYALIMAFLIKKKEKQISK